MSKQDTSCSRMGVYEAMNPLFRETMEDAHTLIDGYNQDKSCGFFAVYDGHGGREAASFLQEHFHRIFLQQLHAKSDEVTIAKIFERAYLIADMECCKNISDTCGATAVTCLVRNEICDGQTQLRKMLHVANVGDSRAVLGTNGTAKRLSYDHKADDPAEVERIDASGGFVLHERVVGLLAVARSFGDRGIKEFVIGMPYVSSTCIDDADFLILACDGIWDVISDEEAVEFVTQSLKQDPSADPTKLAKMLVDEALKRESTDNITTVIVVF